MKLRILLQANVGNQAMARLRIDAGRVARVGVAVGVTIGNVIEEAEVVSMCHGSCLYSCH